MRTRREFLRTTVGAAPDLPSRLTRPRLPKLGAPAWLSMTLGSFLSGVRADFGQHGAQLIYGTIRLIEKDDESLLDGRPQPARGPPTGDR